MIITKKHISRRTVLRGIGATLALPFLDAMVPAATAMAQTAASPKPRFVGCFVPHGMAPGYWIPSTEGKLLPPSFHLISNHLNRSGANGNFQRLAFPIGRAASGSDGGRSLGGVGIPVRQ